MVTVEQWLDAQSRVPDGDEDDGVEAPDFPRDDDPELFDVAQRYLDLRDRFADAANDLASAMFARGWEAR
jgi:hypothetical protein